VIIATISTTKNVSVSNLKGGNIYILKHEGIWGVDVTETLTVFLQRFPISVHYLGLSSANIQTDSLASFYPLMKTHTHAVSDLSAPFPRYM